MADLNKKVTIQNIIESQIPEFLNEDNPLFKEFLEQYYLSQEHKTGTIDLVNNYTEYKEIESLSQNISNISRYSCILKEDIRSFDDSIEVLLKDNLGNIIENNTTFMFPDKYGIIKIDNEVITYTYKTDNSFEGCVRGFSGINSLEVKDFNSNINFVETIAESHRKDSVVKDLNSLFYVEFFRKFKSQFLPGFENRNINSDVNLKNILSRAKDYYTSKGTDESYKILFKILYNEDIEIIKPQQFLLRASANNYFVTRNILVEKIFGDLDPISLIGKTINQQNEFGIASASIFNVEVRPIGQNRILYEISLDPESIISNFIETKTTKVVEDRNYDSNSILVDSTIGFKSSGTLLAKSSKDGSISTLGVTYSDKTVNEFLGISTDSVNVYAGDLLIENNFAYVVSDSETVSFRVLNVIQDVDISNTSKLSVGDKINLYSFGEDLSELPQFKSWIYNNVVSHEIKEITSTSNNIIFQVKIYNKVRFLIGQNILFYNNGDDLEDYVTGSIRRILDDYSFEIISNSSSILQKKNIYTPARRSNLLKFPNVDKILANVQNTYINKNTQRVYVTSSGMPGYPVNADSGNVSVTTNSGIGFTNVLNTNIKHNFYTGEKIYLTNSTNLGISTGSYYVTTLGSYGDSQRLSLSYSGSDVFSKKYINFSSGGSGNIIKADQEDKNIQHQKLIREFDIFPKYNNSGNFKSTSTNNKQIGMLVNGVEIYSPTLFDENIYFGKIENIQLLKNGTDYDVINRPELEILDEVSNNSGISTYGYGAKAYLNINGSLKGFKVIDPGFGYDKNIKISLLGGNGSGSSIEPIIIKQRLSASFIPNGGINPYPSSNTIKFLSNHNFQDSELVEYVSNGNSEVRYFIDDTITTTANLPTNTFYYVGVVDQNEIKLYKTKFDSANKINEIKLANSSSALGVHKFVTTESKSVLSEILINNPGSNYSNKIVVIPSRSDSNRSQNGVNLKDSFIYAKNHNFNEKDLVVYTSTGSEIVGLSTNSYYYVNVVDSNNFRLSYAGNESNITDFNYNNRIYSNFSTLGTGNHTFSYPPIYLKIDCETSNLSGNLQLPTLEPLVLGDIESIFVEEYGENYGTPDILNYHRRPEVKIKTYVSEAQIKPILDNGTIIGIQILDSGAGYGLDYDLEITGTGNFAELKPIITNGVLSDVLILNGGVGYDRNTDIRLVKRGDGAKFICNIYEWKINQILKNRLSLESPDEGLIAPSKNFESGLQFIHFYPPNYLRVQLDDYLIDNSTQSEVINVKESPILGWSYDGFPIYGPFYTINGELKKVKSSYRLDVETNNKLRPTRSEFPGGFFIQDYIYDKSYGDLDEFNGLHIRNSDFPEGTYAYFFTLSDNIVNNRFFPQYPYVLSENFKGIVNENNFKPSINQDIDLTELDIIRNVSPYYINNERSSYIGLTNIDEKYKQQFVAKSIGSGSIDSIEIYSPGDGYKVGEIIEINKDPADDGTGSGASASILEVSGPNVSSIEIGITTIKNVSFSNIGNSIVAFCTVPHNLYNGEIISISNISPQNTYLSNVTSKKIKVNDRKVGLSSDISSIGETGSIIFMYVYDTFGFTYGDFIKVGSESFKILDIIPELSAFKVKRAVGGVSGIHTSGINDVFLLPKTFEFYEESENTYSKINTIRFFDPQTSVSLAGTDLQYYNLGIVSTIIPKNGIYLHNHEYYTGQPIEYNYGDGSLPIQVYNSPGDEPFALTNGQIVYAINLGKDFIGISTLGFTTSSGIGTEKTTLYFDSEVSGIGKEHYFTTTFPEIVGDVESYNLTIELEKEHNLIDGETIKLDLLPKVNKIVEFKYDSNIDKITTSPIDFSPEIQIDGASNINLNNYDFYTGEKVVYYTNGNTPISGLLNNSVYYVIKTKNGGIRLANTYYDSNNGNYIELDATNLPSGTHSIAKINPPIYTTYGDLLEFDLSDDSLDNFTLFLYKDRDFKVEFPQYEYTTLDGKIVIDTTNIAFTEKIYYNFVSLGKLYPDSDVFLNNSINIEKTKYLNKFEVIKINDTKIKVNLQEKPESVDYNLDDLNSLSYSTNSTNAIGPIHSVKINYKGKNYNKIPLVKRIISEGGKDAILNIKSNSIGNITYLDRIKDGYDYPSDSTLVPKFSTPAIVRVENVSRIGEIIVLDGGKNYNLPPSLLVYGRNDIELEAITEGGSVSAVKIIKNANNLNSAFKLKIIPTKNSNGYSIDDITVNGNLVTLELLNSSNEIYPLINVGYGSTEFIFPFEVGDKIFIENCRLTSESVEQGFENFNSSNFDYNLFTITSIDKNNYTITYNASEYGNSNITFGEYTSDFGYGVVVNQNDLASFEVVIQSDSEFKSGEVVYGYNGNSQPVFTAKVLDNGWNNRSNQLRLVDLKGKIALNDTIVGSISNLNGKIIDLDVFELQSNLGVTREKINDTGDSTGFTNNSQNRISDNNYYQKFSYSIKSSVPYNVWREPVRSLIHPSGFKEFSDLDLNSYSKKALSVGTEPILNLEVDIDNVESMYKKTNFTLVTEDEELFEDGSTERVLFGEGVELKPYILSKTNKVIKLDDISSDFDGSSNYQIIDTKLVTFYSNEPYKIGVDTQGLAVGDRIGFSTYHYYPDSTFIDNIGVDYVGISTQTPNRLNSIGIGSTTQSLDFYRRILGDRIIGRTEFNLTSGGYPVFYRQFNSNVDVNLELNSFNIQNHNFQTGQSLTYSPELIEAAVAIADTTIGSGAILEPIFDDFGNYSVQSIKIISGGQDYDPVNVPKIDIINTVSPIEEANLIANVDPSTGEILNVDVGYGQSGYGYFPLYSGVIGIQTTNLVEGRKDIIMQIGAGVGSAIYENGYNVAISTSVIGITSSVAPDYSGEQNIMWGPIDPYIPQTYTSGSGTGARFSLFVVYDSDTGIPISTSLILRDGGRGYSVGESVSISGTHFGGSTPQNDISFVISKVSSTTISGEENQSYLNVSGDSIVGYGTGAKFDVYRDELGQIETVNLKFGGKNYSLEDNIRILGTDIGGSTPGDDLFLSPTILGTDKLPEKVYVNKRTNSQFQVTGTLDGEVLNLTSVGVGTHSFQIEDPNVNTLITIDNIIQNPVYNKNLELQLTSEVKTEDTTIDVTGDLSSLLSTDILKIGNELLAIKNLDSSIPNTIQVERAILGTTIDYHQNGSVVKIVSGNYNIVKDKIYFGSAPYGKKGIYGMEVSSSFSGRVFSRSVNSAVENDNNIIFDDISDQFTGFSTNFLLKSNGANVSGMFTDNNSITGSTGSVDINNNPLILINNILQIGGIDYIIDTPVNNTIRFKSGSPIAGKITKVGYTTGFGYYNLVGAGASAVVSVAGTISSIQLLGSGKGYRVPPTVTVSSTVGYGASITSEIDSDGKVTSFIIINPGVGYTQSNPPDIIIEPPNNYNNLSLQYADGYSGLGIGAKCSVVVGSGSSIISFTLDDPGISYKVGDVLTLPDLIVDESIPGFDEFKVTILETYTDSFSGWYPGQFIQFDDISPLFNGRKKKFTLTITTSGEKQALSIKSNDIDLDITNNLIVVINDIIQVPGESYTFSGSRLVFKEAPKSGSKSNILFFRGSDIDIEQVDPPKTIKIGDEIQINESALDQTDVDQSIRIVKDIITVDSLDTFNYNGVGINTDQNKQRPLTWIKQTQDRVINGVLYSKSRPSLKSRVTPTTKVIKDIKISDTQIYVDSAVPLFQDVDENRGLDESIRDVIIVNNIEVESPTVETIVSPSGTVSQINIIDPGSGYLSTYPLPEVIFSKDTIERKDPIKDWKTSDIEILNNINSIGYGTVFVSVGNSSSAAISNSGITWENISISNNLNINFVDVIGFGNTYVAVGSSASVYRSTGVSTNVNWQQLQLLKDETVIDASPVIEFSTYTGGFNSINFDSTKNTLVIAGDVGRIFYAVGISTNAIFENQIGTNKLNSVVSNGSIFVVVGNSKTILYSIDGKIWNPSITNNLPQKNLKSIIWRGNRFIAVGDDGTIITSTNGVSWSTVTNNISSVDITKIYYSDGIYTILDSSGNLYFSLDLEYWEERQVISNSVIVNDIISINTEDGQKYVSVGNSGFVGYSTEIVNSAVAISSVTPNGELSQITITNQGFGYKLNQNVPTIININPTEIEKIFSIKAKGDYGNIIGINLDNLSGNPGFGTTSPAIEFTLKSEVFNLDNPNVNIEFSPLSTGDYFVISESNIVCGHALTGITTSLGGMSNYPNSKVGTSRTFIDGIYRVEYASSSASGIVTVRCNFLPAVYDELGPGKIVVNEPDINSVDFYGKYSFGLIYDYQNRFRENPKNFIINSDNGIVGLNSGPSIYRSRSII